MFQAVVKNCPSQDLALTNCAFCNVNDVGLFGPYVELAGSCVLSVVPDDRVEPGGIALNAIHRRYLRVSSGEPVSCESFVPPAVGFGAGMLTAELEFVSKKGQPMEVDATQLSANLVRRFASQVFTLGQKVTFEFCGVNFIMTVQSLLAGDEAGGASANRGLVLEDTAFAFEAAAGTGIKVQGQKSAGKAIFKSKEVSFEKLGIGGLDDQFAGIFRRVFASRMYPPHTVAKLGIKHVKGMLLYGPPGTGKTLIARQLGKMLNGKEPKVVNGPEVLNKYVGASEENIRNLFKEAEADQAAQGDESELHIIIFDEIDAICKARGSVSSGTGVHDTVVNQLLTKIDGVDALNNILLIGMTNRKDMLDEAMLRPGRLEVQVEISLPDEAGRVQILHIHTASMDKNSFMDRSVDVHELARRTKNFSGAEIEGLVKSAVSFALARHVDMSNIGAGVDEDNIKVTWDDFERALEEVQPAFGAAISVLERCRLGGMIHTGGDFAHLMSTCRTLVEQVGTSDRTPLLSAMLAGPIGAGKTALAATLAIESGFHYVKVVSSEAYVGFTESAKVNAISKVFEDAYKSPLSVVVLDDIERLLEYVSIGHRFSNLVLQALLVMVKRQPPEGKKLLVLGTSSNPELMEQMELDKVFNVTLEVRALEKEGQERVLSELGAFDKADMPGALSLLPDRVPIKRLLMLVEMARQGGGGGMGATAEGGRIALERFQECMD